MRKICLLVVLIFTIGLSVFAQEKTAARKDSKVSIGLGAEFNMNSRENFAGGAVLGFNFNLGSSFAVGLVTAASYNFSEIFVLEPSAFFRWYFLSNDHTGFFIQTDAGAYLIFEKDEDIVPLFMGGLRAGYRLPLGELFYVEPFGRVGYPFMFGVGALAGIRF